VLFRFVRSLSFSVFFCLRLIRVVSPIPTILCVSIVP